MGELRGNLASAHMESLQDDGLVTPIVGAWAEETYRLVECYAQIFATAMKRKSDMRVYVDLFSEV